MGKTALALFHGMKSGEAGIYFNLEMSKSQLCQRLILQEAGDTIHSSRLRDGNLSQSELHSFEKTIGNIEKAPFLIYDKARCGVHEAIRVMKREHRKGRCKWAIIDYLQLMTIEGSKALARKEIKDVMDLCLSCKGCKSECPSNVDVGKLKAEFLQHHHNQHGVPLRSRVIGHFSDMAKIGMLAPGFYNLFTGNNFAAKSLRKLIGFAPERQLPRLQKQTLKAWFQKEGKRNNPVSPQSSVWFFADEFSNFNDTEAGKKAIQLLQGLGYHVEIPNHKESGRAFLSKGMLKEAGQIASENVEMLFGLVNNSKPMITELKTKHQLMVDQARTWS
jgi:Fe-S oxidoreductase